MELREFLGLLEEQLLLLGRGGVGGQKLVLTRGRRLQEELCPRGLRMGGEELLLASGVRLLEEQLALRICGLLQQRVAFAGGDVLQQMLLRATSGSELELMLVVRLRRALQQQVMRGGGVSRLEQMRLGAVGAHCEEVMRRGGGRRLQQVRFRGVGVDRQEVVRGSGGSREQEVLLGRCRGHL